MRITCKRADACSACGGQLQVGTEVEWERHFGARCASCADARRYPLRRNLREQACSRCGLPVPPGLGWLEAAGASEWSVRCRDEQGCGERVTYNRAHPRAP